MKYRVHACLAFDSKEVATAFMEAIKKDYLSVSVSINESKEIAELSSCHIEECHHDESPSKPCAILEKWEVKAGSLNNTVKATKSGYGR